MSQRKHLEIFTDGACSGNPGPGGWGAILMYGVHKKEISGGEAETTNNRMELTAVISALEMLKVMEQKYGLREQRLYKLFKIANWGGILYFAFIHIGICMLPVMSLFI